jgi:hypothetical protein
MLIVVSGAAAAAQLAALLVPEGGSIELLLRAIDGDDTATLGLGLAGLLGLLSGVTLILGAFAWMWWFDGAWCAVRHLTGQRPTHGRVGAMAWWFVPFLGYWKAPERVADVHRRAVDPRGLGPWLVPAWAVAFAVSQVLGTTVPRVILLTAGPVPSRGVVESAQLAEQVALVATAVAAVLAVMVIAVITGGLRSLAGRPRRVAELGPDAATPPVGLSVLLDHGPRRREPAAIPAAIAVLLIGVAVAGAGVSAAAIQGGALDGYTAHLADASAAAPPGQAPDPAPPAPDAPRPGSDPTRGPGASPATLASARPSVDDDRHPVVRRLLDVGLDPGLSGSWTTRMTFRTEGQVLYTIDFQNVRSGADHWSRISTRIPGIEVPPREDATIGGRSYTRDGDEAWTEIPADPDVEPPLPVLGLHPDETIRYLGRTRLGRERLHRLSLDTFGEEFMQGVNGSLEERGEAPGRFVGAELLVRDDGTPVRFTMRGEATYRGSPVEIIWRTAYSDIGRPVRVALTGMG